MKWENRELIIVNLVDKVATVNSIACFPDQPINAGKFKRSDYYYDTPYSLICLS